MLVIHHNIIYYPATWWDHIPSLTIGRSTAASPDGVFVDMQAQEAFPAYGASWTHPGHVVCLVQVLCNQSVCEQQSYFCRFTGASGFCRLAGCPRTSNQRPGVPRCTVFSSSAKCWKTQFSHSIFNYFCNFSPFILNTFYQGGVIYVIEFRNELRSIHWKLVNVKSY